MKRKLMKMGKHTLLATIPSKWIQKHNLKSGNYVEFKEDDNKLILTSTAEIYEKKIEITINSSTIMAVWRSMQPVYTSGFDEVKINFKDKKTLKLIEDNIKGLMGFEIVETRNNFVVIKSVSKQLDEEFPTILRRVFFILKNMIETTKEALENNDKKKLEEIFTLETTINRYTMFLKRLINRTGYKHPHYIYLIITFLELTANHLDYIRRYYKLNPKTKIEKLSVKEFNKLYDLNEKIYDLYYNYSDDKFLWIAEELPHFKWFRNIKDPEIRLHFVSMAEYLVQVSRQIKALHT